MKAFLARKQSSSPETNDAQKRKGGSPEADTDYHASKSMKTGDVYKCALCSYTTDKQSSLNRHKRIHNRGDSTSDESRNDTYCAKCNIQFSSYSTYRCHRDVYCPKRSSDVDSRSNSSLSPGVASPRSDILPEVYHDGLSLSLREAMLKASSASTLSGQARVILAPPIVAPSSNGTGGGFNYPTVIVQPVVASSESVTAKNDVKVSPKLDLMKTKVDDEMEQPLDLSKGKSSSVNQQREAVSPTEKKHENKIKEEPTSPRSISSNMQTPPTPATPNAKPSPSPSQSSGRSSEKLPVAQSPILTPTLPPIMAVHQLPFIGNMGKPIPPVPHAVSKCVDCNIVFYKRENFLIHKKHYCSSRRNKSPDSDDSGMHQQNGATFILPPAKSDLDSTLSDQDHSEKTFHEIG